MSVPISAVTIGAAPRPDLTSQLRTALPDVDVLEIGALDDLAEMVSPPAPGPGSYPLRTRTPDGRTVVADEAWLTPRVQAAVDRGEASGADLTILLCAGGFASVTAIGPLLRPFDVATDRLWSLGAHRLGVIVPLVGQVVPSRAKWEAAGFAVDVVVGSPSDAGRFAESMDPPDAIVLDYVGHQPSEVASAAEAACISATAAGRPLVPIIDLLAVTVEAAVARIGR